MRFLLDEDVHPVVADAARGLGLDVVSVHELDRLGLSDQDQLEYATEEGRILVTRNRDDFIRLTVSFFQSGRLHRGLIIVPYTLPNKDPARIAHALKKWSEHRSEDELEYGIFFLEK